MEADPIDQLQRDWARQRPDLDHAAIGVVLRIDLLARLLNERAQERLRKCGLEWWQYDALSALRRQGAPWRLPATRLAEQVRLTSGALTHRVDRLEALGWVSREQDPRDRRRVMVSLTKRGRAAVDRATAARFEVAAEAVRGLDDEERRTIDGLLRELLQAQ
ncbi:MAG: MarR family transcriptional regulator [Gammaproteobacteria bacterium]